MRLAKTLAAIIIFLGSVSTLLAKTPQFIEPFQVNIGGAGEAVALGDFNRDGEPILQLLRARR